MKFDQFNSTKWTVGMWAIYDGEEYAITSCDFGEQLVGLRGVVGNAPDETSWVRCENVTIVRIMR